MSTISNTLASYTTLLILLLMGMAGSAHAQTSPEAVQALLQDRDQEIKAVLGTQDSFTDAQRAELKDLINGFIDFEAMGRHALGRHWEPLSETEQTEFVTVFSDIVRNQSLADLDVYRADVQYQSVDVDGDSAYVVTATSYQNVATEVAYVLGHDGTTWRAHDILLDDVSTADGYARSFQTMIRKRGFEALMTQLEKKRDASNTR
ncbi:MAG: ABC transporter substrate-binding protein [Bacteroidota bacterium]